MSVSAFVSYRRPFWIPTEPRWSVWTLSSPGGRTGRQYRDGPVGGATSFPALHTWYRERRADGHPPLPVPRQRERRSRPGADAADGHRLHPERHHAPAALPLRPRPLQLQALTRHRQQQTEPAAVLWGGVWVHRYDIKYDMIKEMMGNLMKLSRTCSPHISAPKSRGKRGITFWWNRMKAIFMTNKLWKNVCIFIIININI